MPEKMKKWFNLDKFYFLMLIIFTIFIINKFNYLDIAYFLLITFYYIRIKLHQKKNS